MESTVVYYTLIKSKHSKVLLFITRLLVCIHTLHVHVHYLSLYLLFMYIHQALPIMYADWKKHNFDAAVVETCLYDGAIMSSGFSSLTTSLQGK